MSNYTKTTNFATKDNLNSGNPLKIVKGTEIDTEFNNIATAVATKTDNSAAAITGGTITGITDLAVADGGTGASTAAGALNNLLPSQTSAANKYLQSDGTNASWDAVTLSTADITGTLGVANGGTGVTTSTGTTNVVLSNSPTLVTPALGTPSAAVLTNATGLPISTGVSGLGTGVATFLATPSSANLASAVSDETGTGALVFANSPTLVTPALGTPASGVATNLTGLPISTGVSGLGTGIATFLATPSSANLAAALTDETGSGANVFATSPTLVTPILGTPTSATLTNATGLPLSTGVTGQLPVANGGTGTATPSIVAGSNVTVTGTWPNQTIASSASGGIAYTAVKTANYTAANNDGVLTNTTGGAFTVTLPTSPSVGNQIIVADAFGVWGTNNLTIDPTALIKIGGQTAGTTLVCNINSVALTLVYSGATYGWDVFAQIGANSTDVLTQTNTVSGITNKTFVAPVLGTPTSATLTNATGLPISTGVSGLGTGIATALAVNVGSSGAPLVNGGVLGTPSSGTATNLTGLPLTTGVTGTLPTANGGTNLGGATPFTSGGVVYASSTSALATGSALQFTGTSLLVGTTSATANFNFLATQATDAPAGLMVENTSNTSSASAVMRYKSSGSIFAYTGLGSPSRSAYAGLGANILSIYTNSDAGISLVVDNAAGPITFNTNSTEQARIPAAGGFQSKTTISVGDAAPSASGAGITFPATQSASSNANTLDDYEEGTWTPSLGGTATYNVQSGNYTKIGRLVNIRCNIEVNSIGTGSTFEISGLPFATFTTSTGNPTASASVGYFGSLAISVTYISVITSSGGTTMKTSGLALLGNTASAALGVFGNSARIDFTVTYFTD